MDVFNALAEPTRRSIIEILADQGQLSSSAIAHRFRSTPSAISQHLKVLREAHLVRMEKRKQQRIYYLNPDGVHEVEDWLKKLAEEWEPRFQRLDALLKEERRKEKRNVKNEIRS
jgi:DNA-binding transcriptional ArsR family regulator